MREIKFRGKRLNHGGWIYGSLIQKKVFEDVVSYIIPDHPQNNSAGDEYYNIRMFPVDTNTVGQFTGIYDIEGYPIFEGDLVLSAIKYDNVYQQGLCEVFYSDEEDSPTGYVGFWIAEGYPSDMNYEQLLKYENQYYRVVGNTHDNSYLRDDDFEDYSKEAKFPLGYWWNDEKEEQLQQYLRQLKKDYLKRLNRH